MFWANWDLQRFQKLTPEDIKMYGAVLVWV